MITQPSFFAAAVPAVILLGLSKGGFAGLGVLGMPLMALTIPPVQAAAITLPILMVQDAFSVWVYRRNWDRTNLKILLPGAVVGIIAAYLLAAKVPDAAVALVLGTISVVFALRRFLGGRLAGAPTPATSLNRPLGWFWGAIAGFTSMIAHAGGPPFQIYVIPQRLPRDLFVGTGVVFFALVNLIKVPPYLALGQFSRENLLTSAVLFPLAIVSTWAGVWLVRRLSGERFYDLIYLLLLLLGGKLVFDGLQWLLP
jgi:uncharacterized membrane protein YfcA